MPVLIQVVVVLIVVGFLLYLGNRLIPMEPIIKNIIIFVVVLAVVLWLLSVFGIFSGFHGGGHWVN